jgi:hypothetical protein
VTGAAKEVRRICMAREIGADEGSKSQFNKINMTGWQPWEKSSCATFLHTTLASCQTETNVVCNVKVDDSALDE